MFRYGEKKKKSPFILKDPLKKMQKKSTQQFSATAGTPMRTSLWAWDLWD